MITIRPAEAADQEKVLDLLRQLMGSASEESAINQPSGIEVFRDIITEGPGAVLVAEEGDDMLGLVTLSFPRAIRCGGPYSCIEEFIVTEKARGKGVGGKLLEAAISRAAEEGCQELQVNRPSEVGYPVYLAHGWKDLGKHLSMQPVQSTK
jgi:GNAT superfamily N-acetyltransferase|tara:strand:- start:646 stop:1098 length:453 start_codon:yes stop_codon:yes gene_type:complete